MMTGEIEVFCYWESNSIVLNRLFVVIKPKTEKSPGFSNIESVFTQITMKYVNNIARIAIEDWGF